jgi:hypothetical protein
MLFYEQYEKLKPASGCALCQVIAALLYIGTNVLLVFWLTSGQKLYRSFVLLPPTKPIGVSELHPKG